ANGIVVRRDFIDKNRAAVVAWLKADIEALLFLRDNPVETVHILKKQLPEYTRENLWFAVYGSLPPQTGAPPGAVRDDLVNQAFRELGLDPTKALFELPGASKNPFKGDALVN